MKRVKFAFVFVLVMAAFTIDVQAQNRRTVAAPTPQTQSAAEVVNGKIPVYIDVQRALQNKGGVQAFVDTYISNFVSNYEVVAERREAKFALEITQTRGGNHSQRGTDERQVALNEIVRRTDREIRRRSRGGWGNTVGDIGAGFLQGLVKNPNYRDDVRKIDITVKLVPLDTQVRVKQKIGADMYELRESYEHGNRRVKRLTAGGDLTEIGLNPKADLSGFEDYYLGLLSLKKQLDLMFPEN